MADKKIVEPGLQQLLRDIKTAPVKTQAGLARELGVPRQSINLWWRVPDRHVIPAETLVGTPRWVQRPDIYPPSDYAPNQGAKTAE